MFKIKKNICDSYLYKGLHIICDTKKPELSYFLNSSFITFGIPKSYLRQY